MNFGTAISEEMKTWMTDVLFLVPNWKWIGLSAAIILGFILHFIFQKTFCFLKESPHIRNRLPQILQNYYTLNTHKPLAWLLTGIFWMVCVNALGFPEKADKFLSVLAQVVISVSIIRLVYLGVEAFGMSLREKVRLTENTLDDQLAPFITKSLKVLVLVLGVLIMVQNFGINVVSLLAGLGLGGLALALAAQDTAANVFGSITIIADRPFQVGDYIKVGDKIEGVVEEVGFRSTRIRTPYRSMITIPNSVIAKENIDNLTVRSGRRIRHTVGFTYDTPVEKMKSFMVEMKKFISEHPKASKEGAVVKFTTMGDFSLGIMVSFFTATNSYDEEMDLQEETLFKMVSLAQELEIEYAFPTQTQVIPKGQEALYGDNSQKQQAPQAPQQPRA